MYIAICMSVCLLDLILKANECVSLCVFKIWACLYVEVCVSVLFYHFAFVPHLCASVSYFQF